MLRRSTGTIHSGHLPEGIDMKQYWELFTKTVPSLEKYNAGAYALELTGNDNLHIQFYLEHDRKRTSTLARDLGLSTEYVFDKVKSARGSWEYCSGTGKYAEKPAVARGSFGDPILYGDDQRADLQHLVACIIDGATLNEIMKQYPYAWCVHRDRLIKFSQDWVFGIPEVQTHNEWAERTS